MASTSQVGDALEQGHTRRIGLAKRTLGIILKPRYSLLDIAITAIILCGSSLTMAAFWAQDYKRKVDAATFVSPMPTVRLVEQDVAPNPVAYKHDYNFTTNWFTHNIPVWEKALASYKDTANVQYLEIGLFEGRSAMWMLENVLTHPTARLTGIDPFDGPYKQRFFSNLERSGSSSKVTTITGYSQIALRKIPLNSYDIIYIDGSHSKEDVLEDAVLCWRLLKDGGILVFDDYRWAGFFEGAPADAPTDFPKTAIDRFVECFDRQIQVIHNSYQLIVKKNAKL